MAPAAHHFGEETPPKHALRLSPHFCQENLVAQVMDVLLQKGSSVHVVPPSTTVLDATRLMNDRHVGALLVTVDPHEPNNPLGHVVGIFTERDVLTRVVAQELNPAATHVEDVMTAVVAYCRPETDLDEVASTMQKRRIRHLPVCDENGRLQGIISIGDINAWHAQGQDATIHYLHEYIHGRA
jgi:CBS domain-containing protein